jgi:hypothetical protein
MSSDKESLTPIMTNSESLFQFGSNAYAKPATALNILRETIMGRELFDYAFKEYANRWKFKHPTPTDFFRTMEDASAVDLDWFWRGWFYTTDHVDISLSNVRYYKAQTKDPEALSAMNKAKRANEPVNISTIRNRVEIDKTLNEIDTTINDYYTTYDALNYDVIDMAEYNNFVESLSDEERALIASDKNYYEINFENKGGLVMPIIIAFEYEDGSTEVKRIPAEIWKMNSDTVTKIFITDQKIIKITLDPFLETADIDRSNNYYPPQPEENRFEIYKRNSSRERENLMQRNNRAKAVQQKLNQP